MALLGYRGGRPGTNGRTGRPAASLVGEADRVACVSVTIRIVLLSTVPGTEFKSKTATPTNAQVEFKVWNLE